MQTLNFINSDLYGWIFRQGDGKYTPDDIDPTLCTHINYGFAVLDANSLTIKPHDSWADIDNGKRLGHLLTKVKMVFQIFMKR